MGILVLLTTALLLRRNGLALGVFSGLLVLTLLWSLWECGLDFWALTPRLNVVGVLGILMILPITTRALSFAFPYQRLVLGATLGVGMIVFAGSMLYDPHDISGKLDLSTETPADAAGKDWAAWGGTGAGDHYSGLNQITPDNVHRLKLAWQFQTGDLRRPTDSGEVTYESTPLKIGNTLYACSPHQIVYAIDASTGKLNWKFDPQAVSLPQFQHLTCRGVAYHETRLR
ncbi:hypothetical protein [Gluconobacter oxydans]|uniref:hypothetical protein n=1 Tax=Gluconobacter oxydans TaxID=442 RepID=UPI001CD81DD0|nr:hypothetical protein [Gluconobacter oxydans]